jgi:hypothetical protein
MTGGDVFALTVSGERDGFGLYRWFDLDETGQWLVDGQKRERLAELKNCL